MNSRRSTVLRLADLLLTIALCVAVLAAFVYSAAIAAALIDDLDRCPVDPSCEASSKITALTVLIIGEALAFAFGTFLASGAALRGDLISPRAALGTLAMATTWPLATWISA
ncbi:hypothetical protein [Nocardia sp. SSK8]|uniref:hypothetical protein n=1 Tax=Nocardia sp. SSK8 TaxID=3120154 RepID=UPI00300904C8